MMGYYKKMKALPTDGRKTGQRLEWKNASLWTSRYLPPIFPVINPGITSSFPSVTLVSPINK